MFKKSTPTKKSVNRHVHINPVPWWDSDCERIKRQRKAAFKKWRFSNDLPDYITYKKLNAEAIKTFKLKKKRVLKSLPVLLISVQTSPTFGINVKNVQPSNIKNNLQQKNDVQVALNKICPPWCETNPNWFPKCKSNSFLDQPFDPVEFNSVLVNKKNTAASGLDGIDYEVIKSLPIDYRLILLEIFNEIYRTDSYPKSWQESYIHFINKPENKGVRPIALTSHLGKLFESLIKNRLQWYCEDQNIMPNNQSGFRKGRSCNNNLADLMLQADQALTKKKTY